MSDDIVGRLRYEYGFGDRLEAADEIDRLRERLAEADEANRSVSDVNVKLRAALNALIEAADNVRHWHDAMSDNSGMVVSKDSVFALWEEATKARAAAAALKEQSDE